MPDSPPMSDAKTKTPELSLPAGGDGALEVDGRRVQMRSTPRRRNRPASLLITVDVGEARAGAPGRPRVATRPLLLLRKETAADRLGKRLGLNRELQVGDEPFDADIYIESDAPDDDVRATLADPSLRQHVRALLASGAARVELDRAGLTAAFVGRPQLGRDGFDAAARHLFAATDALPLFETGQVGRSRSLFGELLTLVTIPLAIVLAAAFVGRYPVLGALPWLVGLGAGLVLWALSLVVLARLVRGHSDSLRRFALAASALLFAVPVSTTTLLLWSNGAYDRSPPVEHQARVARLWSSQDKSGHKTWYVAAEWDGGQPLEITIPDDAVANTTVGQPALLTINAGRLGWPWLRSFRTLP